MSGSFVETYAHRTCDLLTSFLKAALSPKIDALRTPREMELCPVVCSVGIAADTLHVVVFFARMHLTIKMKYPADKNGLDDVAGMLAKVEAEHVKWFDLPKVTLSSGTVVGIDWSQSKFTTPPSRMVPHSQQPISYDFTTEASSEATEATTERIRPASRQ